MMKFLAAASVALFLAFAADPPTSLHTGEIVAHLARTIAWYRHVVAVEQSAQPPADLLAQDGPQRTATRALQLAFDFARTAAPIITPAPFAAGTTPAAGSSMERTAARATERVAAAEAQLAQVDEALTKAGVQARATLTARRKELVAELNFARQIKDSVQSVRTFLSGQATGGADLLGFVDRLERSVPEAMRSTQQQPGAAAAAGTTPAPLFRPESAGIFALITEGVGMARAKSQFDDAIAETDALRTNLDQIRAPIVADLTAAVRRSDVAMNDSASQTVEQMDADRKEIEALSARFKQLSAAMVPLREHRLQVDITRSSLIEQRKTVGKRYSAATAYLLLRVLGVILAILLVLGISELWRRGTFRYVRDPRRRKQFLVMRRVVVACVITAAIIVGLVNELGSLATYAGLLTAGLAVALQNVIVSVVAYFFLIGRYGLRVGDRVTINGVTGDVLEIGLVRLYLMEMSGGAADLQPTGRVVGFSNSVLFQPSALFRQMPGADYVWHSVALTLTPDTDLQVAESRLMAAVEAVYEPYRERVEQQHAAFQRLVDLPVPPPKPVGRLRFTSEGLEFLVRYPAEMKQATTTDDRVVSALREAIEHEPRLSLAGSGAPKLQSTV
jgi:small-conductance mechanosensitive channel